MHETNTQVRKIKIKFDLHFLMFSQNTKVLKSLTHSLWVIVVASFLYIMRPGTHKWEVLVPKIKLVLHHP